MNLILALLFSMNGMASSTRIVEADQITSSDKSKTFGLPSVNTTLLGTDNSVTITNKTISGANNTLQQLPVAAQIVNEQPTGTVNGTNKDFTTTYNPVGLQSIQVMLNGVVLEPTTDFTLSGNVISFISAPANAQKIRVIYSRY